MKKVLAFLNWLFVDPEPMKHEHHSVAREAENRITPCGAYRCPGANDQLCEACRANPKLTGANHA